MIIGLSGKARVGKDTVADLMSNYGFVKAAFADSLKRAVGDIFDLTPAQLYGDLKEQVDPFWNDTPRNILQKVGTECLRRGYRDDVWIKSLERRIVDHPTAYRVDWVVSDVRFPNEAEAIHRWGGLLVQVVRPDAPAIQTNQHASETSMNQWGRWDYMIENVGTLQELSTKVDELVGIIRRSPP